MLKRILAALAVSFALVASPAVADAPAEIKGAKTVSTDQVIDLITKTGNLVVLDNRKPEDFSAGHIEGAQRLLDSDVSGEALAKLVPAKDTPVLFYCNGMKCGRAAHAVEKAITLGYNNIYYYATGMEDWNKRGLPVVKN